MITFTGSSDLVLPGSPDPWILRVLKFISKKLLLVRYVQNLLQNLGPLQVVGPVLLGRASAVKDGEVLVGLQDLLLPVLCGADHISLPGCL